MEQGRTHAPMFGAPPLAASGPGAAAASRKINNIWGAVVQEQTQEVVAAELCIMGMEGAVSTSERQSETYNYVLARKMMERERAREGNDETAMLDEELEHYMKGQGPTSQQQGPPMNESDGHLKRKRSAKERLGPRAEMDFKGRYEITEHDEEAKVVDEIAHR